MASARFYLERRKESNGQVREDNIPIYLYFSYEGRRFQYYTGERISLTNWDEKRQRAKPSYPGSLELNQYLELISEKAHKIYRESRLQGFIPTVEFFKDSFKKKEAQRSKNFYDHFQAFLESKKAHASEASIRKYRQNLNHLRRFSQLRKYTLEFDSINDDFFNKYVDFFIHNLGHTNNTINRNVKTLKTFLNWATKHGYNTKLEFKNFSYRGYEGEIVHLTYEELMYLYRLELNNERLDKVRDAFCFGCFSGLRYSDIKNLKKENIQYGFIRSYSIKTKDQLDIPINQFMQEILNKYRDNPTQYCIPVMSNQRMNDYLKELGKLAQFMSPINIVRFQGSERIEQVYLKYELLSTHVARKTFVTIAYQKGIPTETIMKITNHKKHDTMKRYLKIGDDLKKKAMQQIF